MDDLQAAIQFATSAHAGQWRDGDHPLPYITHPIDVLSKLRHVGQVTDSAMLCAAMLHDVIEETSVSEAQLASEFGPEISDLVAQLTRTEPTASEIMGLTKPQIWELRSEMLLGNIQHDMDARAQAIKLADRLSNLEEAIRTRSSDKLQRYIGQTHRILAIIPRQANEGLYQAVYSLANAPNTR